MAQTVDEERLKGKPFFRDGVEIKPLMQMENNNPPLKQIPHMDFPRVVYKHPNEPFMEIEHRNAKFEVVGIEVVSAEHLTMKVADETALKAALKDGWVKEPYIPAPLPNRNAGLYAKKAEKAS